MQHQNSVQSNNSHQMMGQQRMSNSSQMNRSQVSSMTGSESRRAFMRRRRPPPSFRPYMIVVLVLSVGLLLIGLTMTIIGVWPSYSPTGGNPLQIVGPIMLGIGLIGLIGMIANICYKKEKEKEAIMQSISDMRSSRMTLASQHSVRTPTPSVNAKPKKSILKASSTSTYNGTAKGSTGDYESDSGMANTHSFSTNRSYERDSDLSDNSRGLDNIKVEMMPDPTAYRHGKPVDQSSTGSDQGVPPSYRYTQQQQPQLPRQSYASHSNQGYQADAKETDIDGDLSGAAPSRHMQDYTGNAGFDMYERSNGAGLSPLTGGGALGSAYSSPVAPVPKQQPQQQRQRWGSKSPRTPSTGQSNEAYFSEQNVSVVSDMYQQAAGAYNTPSSGHYTSYAHSEGRAQPTSEAPSSSTEV